MAPPVYHSSSSGFITTAATTHVVNLPSGVQTGDYLLLFGVMPSGGGPELSGAGWSLVDRSAIDDTNAAGEYTLLSRVAAGAESTSSLDISVSQPLSYVCLRFSNAVYGGRGLFTAASDNSPDPVAPPAPETSESFYLAAMAAWHQFAYATTFPSGFSLAQPTSNASGPYTPQPQEGVAVALKQVASSENPSAFTLASPVANFSDGTFGWMTATHLVIAPSQANDSLIHTEVGRPSAATESQPPTTVLSDGIAVATYLGQPDPSQASALNAAGTVSNLTNDTPSLGQIGVIDANWVCVKLTTGLPSPSQAFALDANDIVSPTVLGRPSLGQIGAINARRICVKLTTGLPSPSQTFPLDANDIVSPTVLGRPSLGQIGAINARRICVKLTTGLPSPSQTFVLDANDIVSPTVLGRPNLGQIGAINARRICVKLTTGLPSPSQAFALDANDIVSPTVLGRPNLGQVGAINARRICVKLTTGLPSPTQAQTLSAQGLLVSVLAIQPNIGQIGFANARKIAVNVFSGSPSPTQSSGLTAVGLAVITTASQPEELLSALTAIGLVIPTVVGDPIELGPGGCSCDGLIGPWGTGQETSGDYTSIPDGNFTCGIDARWKANGSDAYVQFTGLTEPLNDPTRFIGCPGVPYITSVCADTLDDKAIVEPGGPDGAEVEFTSKFYIRPSVQLETLAFQGEFTADNYVPLGKWLVNGVDQTHIPHGAFTNPTTVGCVPFEFTSDTAPLHHGENTISITVKNGWTFDGDYGGPLFLKLTIQCVGRSPCENSARGTVVQPDLGRPTATSEQPDIFTLETLGIVAPTIAGVPSIGQIGDLGTGGVHVNVINGIPTPSQTHDIEPNRLRIDVTTGTPTPDQSHALAVSDVYCQTIVGTPGIGQVGAINASRICVKTFTGQPAPEQSINSVPKPVRVDVTTGRPAPTQAQGMSVAGIVIQVVNGVTSLIPNYELSGIGLVITPVVESPERTIADENLSATGIIVPLSLEQEPLPPPLRPSGPQHCICC